MPCRPVLRMVLPTILADAPAATPERWMPSRPPVMVKPLMVISRPRTKNPSPLAGAVITVLPCPSSVTRAISAGMATFSALAPVTSMVSPGRAAAILSWIFSPALQSTTCVVGMGLPVRNVGTRKSKEGVFYPRSGTPFTIDDSPYTHSGGQMLKLNHLHLKTQDPDKTVQFYVDTFGAKVLNKNARGGYRI